MRYVRWVHSPAVGATWPAAGGAQGRVNHDPTDSWVGRGGRNAMRHIRRAPTLITLLTPVLALTLATALAKASAAQVPQASLTKKVAQDARLPEAPASAAGATYVGDEECGTCHKPEKANFDKTLHSKAVDSRTPAAVRSCETCHGPGSKHVEDPDNPVRNFRTVSADEASAVCTTCHASSEHALWA